MPTLLDTPAVADSWHLARPDALRLADEACRLAIEQADLGPEDIDLLVNAGVYHSRALGEPALAALVQEDVGINPADPSPSGRGSFSFDVANGSCGVLTALQIVDGFLTSEVVDEAVVVASDASPGRRLAPHFPFRSVGAAIRCHRADGPGALGALGGFRWASSPDGAALFEAAVRFDGSRNRLDLVRDPAFDARAAAVAASAVKRLLHDFELEPDDVGALVAAPLTEEFRLALAAASGFDPAAIVRVEHEDRVHTAALLLALRAAGAAGLLGAGKPVLMVAAGAGIVAGAAILLP